VRKDYRPQATTAETWTEALGAVPEDPGAGVGESEFWNFMRPWVDELPPRARIVDGGCGQGGLALHLARRGFEVTGLDTSEPIINVLHRRFPEVDWRVADVRETGLPAATADVYLSAGVFEHFEDGPGACLAEARRVLRPRGLLFLSVPFENARLALREQFARAASASDGQHFYQWRLTRADLARELSAGGFDVLLIRPGNAEGGARRALHELFSFDPASRTSVRLSGLVARFVPAAIVGHMVFGAARRS
jgi:2-polyprenyl-3-methyl-5-hydroxy-6-metoxy-1,4-benzoquinol methylase